MNAIVSVTSDWGIGFQGRLLVRNRDDMRFFKEHTMGGTILCGQTTFEGFPGGALKGRRNVVLSLDGHFSAPGAEVVRSLEEALDATAADDPERVWLIGGESVYRQLIDCCRRAYVTKNHVLLPADAYFPNLDDSPHWRVIDETPGGLTPDGVPFRFVTYERI